MDAYDKALSLLSVREHTIKNMKEKLLKKGYTSLQADEALSALIEENCICDSRFAESWVRATLKRKAYGRYILFQRLMEKGVDKATAEEAVNNAWNNGEFLPALKKEYSRLEAKYGSDKAEMKLKRKGFSSGEIREAEEHDD